MTGPTPAPSVATSTELSATSTTDQAAAAAVVTQPAAATAADGADLVGVLTERAAPAAGVASADGAARAAGAASAAGGTSAVGAAPAAGAPITRPADALAELLAGNRRFVSGQPEHGHDVSAAAAASGGQLPHAVVVGCIDSRVPLEAIFDQTFGSICVIRSGGHVVDRAVLGSVGFAVSALKVPLILVLGHVRCGAVDATVQSLRTGTRPAGDVAYLVEEIAPAVQSVGTDDPEATEKAVRAHVMHTVRRLRDVAGVPEAVAAGTVAIAGAVYDLDTGCVELLT